MRAVGEWLYFCDPDYQGGGVWRVNAKSKAYEKVCALEHAFWVDYDSTHNLVVATLWREAHRVPAQANATPGPALFNNPSYLDEAKTKRQLQTWVTCSVDRNGTMGEVDSIIILSTHGVANTDMYRLTSQGINKNGFSAGGGSSVGRWKFEPFGHYLWTGEVHPDQGMMLAQGFAEDVPSVIVAEAAGQKLWAADAERVFRDMVGQGNKLIFGTTFGYMEPMLKTAPDAKDVKFEHATGYKQADNLRTYDSRTYEGAYMAGVIAGKMTKTNVLGVVGSIPIPEVIRNINAFTLGAQSTNPKIKTKVVWVNEWFNPPKETEAAQSLINGGADVLMHK